MQILHTLLDFVLHMDVHLNDWIGVFGPGIYGILFLIIFCETGLVITPFLPGDSLLFALGALTAVENPQLSLGLLILTLVPAALIGDITNYSIGRYLGQWVLNSPLSRIIQRRHLDKTQTFYDKHGGKTIILARFIPLVRTFAPFVAGVGKMQYGRFISFSVAGAFAWVPVFLGLGHWFGNLPAVKSRFHIVIVGIILVSLLPIVWEWLQSRRAANGTEKNLVA